MKGTLHEGKVPSLLREIYVGRESGLLSFRRGQEQRGVRFRKGHLVGADTNVSKDRLGEVLMRQGLLSEAERSHALELAEKSGKRLGAVLLEEGSLTKQQLEDALALHVHEILAKVFTWRDGSYSFTPEDEAAPIPDDLSLKVSTGELILEAARSVEDPDVVRYCLGDIDRVLGLPNDPLLRFQHVTLTPTDGYVLSRVDGTLSAREVVAMIPLPPEGVHRSLFALISTGMIQYLSLPPRPRLAADPGTARRSQPGEALGMEPAPAAAPRPEPAAPPAAPVSLHEVFAEADADAAPEPLVARAIVPEAAPVERAAVEEVVEMDELSAPSAAAAPPPPAALRPAPSQAPTVVMRAIDAPPAEPERVSPTAPTVMMRAVELPAEGAAAIPKTVVLPAIKDEKPPAIPKTVVLPAVRGPLPAEGTVPRTVVLPAVREPAIPRTVVLPAVRLPAGGGADSETRRREILEAHAALGRRSHFEVLGLEPDASEAKIKEAYFRLAKRFHPDIQHEAALSDLRQAIEDVFARIGEAYAVLGGPERRAAYAAELARPAAAGSGQPRPAAKGAAPEKAPPAPPAPAAAARPSGPAATAAGSPTKPPGGAPSARPKPKAKAEAKRPGLLKKLFKRD